jgi:hypothetical protein
MSEKLKILYYTLWIAHPLLQIAIAGVMLQQNLQRKFRFFFCYIVTQIVTFAIVFPAYWNSSTACFYLSWSCYAVSVAFGFAVIHEVFVDVFRSFHTLRDLGSVLFKWAGLVMLLVAGVVSVSTNSSEMAPWMQALITTQRCVRIVQVGMVLFLLFFSRYMGLDRRQKSFGIAFGFGSFAVVELALVASWVGNHLGNPWMSLINMMFYNASLVLWLGYITAKSPCLRIRLFPCLKGWSTGPSRAPSREDRSFPKRLRRLPRLDLQLRPPPIQSAWQEFEPYRRSSGIFGF